jgi:hypothetical protein
LDACARLPIPELDIHMDLNRFGKMGKDRREEEFWNSLSG